MTSLESKFNRCSVSDVIQTTDAKGECMTSDIGDLNLLFQMSDFRAYITALYFKQVDVQSGNKKCSIGFTFE